MLIRFRVENHRSIREEQELSLVASSLSEHPESVVHVERYDFGLLRTAAIYGANASGKSTLLDAFQFMRTAVADSHRKWAPDRGVPRLPFALDPAAFDSPSLFSLDLLLDGVRYEYGFVVDSSRVLEEWLYAYPKGRRQEWFTRTVAREQEFAFSRLLQGENRAISNLTRPNSLFLSAAAQNNHPVLEPINRWFSAGSVVLDEKTRSSVDLAVFQLCRSEQLQDAILALLGSADLGITDVDVIEEDWSSFTQRFDISAEDLGLHEPSSAGMSNMAVGVRLRHRTASSSEGIALPFDQESQGTRAMFSVAGLVVIVLSIGGLLMVDELDRSLHPHLAMKIVNLFNDPATNPKNAQLVFNTHDTNLLDTDILRRDQIWFTEKGDEGATRLFPLTDFRARKYENLERGYLQGRYGAVPAVRTPDLRRVVGE